MEDVEFVKQGPVEEGELVALYASVGWSSYTDHPERLTNAIEGSSFVVTARRRGELVGLARTVSDDASIVYLQDIVVDPIHQGSGIGRKLISIVIDRYAHVRQKVLLTDDENRQHAFYRSFGFSDVNDIDQLHAFVRFDSGTAGG